MIHHRPGSQTQEWLNDPYTRHLHKQAENERLNALRWLFDACAKSTDPDVRAAMATYSAHNQLSLLFEYKEIAKEKT